MNGTPAARSRSRAPTVFASCISDNVPSCIRAPPDADTTISGIRSSSADSAARVTFSPTTAPIEPPMNPKSMTQIATGWPSTRPVPQTAASRMPVASWAAAIRSGIGLLVHEAERILRLEAGVALGERAVIEEQREARRGRQAEVMAAGGADPEDLVELLVEQHLAARRALRPEVRRVGVAARPERRQLDRHVSPPAEPTASGRSDERR